MTMKTSSKKWQKIRKIKGLRQFVTWYPRHVSENPGYIIKIINPGIIIVVKHSLLSVSIRNNSFLTIINILLISVLLLYYNTLQKKHPLMIFLFLFLKYYLHIPIYHLLQCLLYQQLFQPLQIYVLKL